jgi:hypothetical protein
MDYKSYYLSQPDLNYFSGSGVQRGYGIGGVFKRFFKWFLPVIKSNGLPIVKDFAKTSGKELLRGVTQVAEDSLAGNNFKESSKRAAEDMIGNISKKIRTGQLGTGYKRKRKFVPKNKKAKKRKINKRKVVDIFS